MATIFILLFVFGLFHFVYESIILPSIRLDLRYKLFGLRDRLRNIKLENDLSEDLFDLLDTTICSTINRLPFLSFSIKLDALNEYEVNEDFRKRVEKKREIIESCKNEEIQKLNKELIELTSFAFIMNAGGWFYITLPILIVILLFGLITHSVKSIINSYLIKETYKATYANDRDLAIPVF